MTQAEFPTFATTDLDLAAGLRTAGYELAGTKKAERDDGRLMVEFVFRDRQDTARDFRRDMKFGNMELNARELLRNLRWLKHLVYQTMNGGERLD